MGRNKSPYLKMLQESLIDFSKMTTHQGPAANVIGYDGKGEMDFYKPVNDVVSILERYYLKEGIIDSDDSPVPTGGGPGREKDVENSEWVEQDLVDIATQKAGGQSGPASGGAGSLPNGEQPEGYDTNLMDQDDTAENKEQTPNYGKKPVQESISLFDDLEALLEGTLPDVESDESTNEVQGADAAAGKNVPELGDSEEFIDDFEVRPTNDQISQATMQEMLEEALEDIDMGDYEDPFLEASEMLEMEDEDTMEPTADNNFGGGEGVPVMPAGDDDSIGDTNDQNSDLVVPPVGDQEDEEDEASVSAEEEPNAELEMYEQDAYGEEDDEDDEDDMSSQSLESMLEEMDDEELDDEDSSDVADGEIDDAEDDEEDDIEDAEDDLADDAAADIESDDEEEDLDEMFENLGDSGFGDDDGTPNVGPGPSGVESVDGEIGPDRGEGTPGAGRRADATAESLEEFDEFLWEDVEDSDGGPDFFPDAVNEGDEEPVGDEDSSNVKDLIGGKNEGIPDVDKASSWAEVDESALFEDVSTDQTPPGKSGNNVVPTGPAHTSKDSVGFEPMEEDADTELTEPGKAGNELTDRGEQVRTDLGNDAGGDGDKLESLEETDDLFQEALREEDEMDLSSEPAEIKNDKGVLPNETPSADENQPAKIENASLTNEQVIIARRKSEESVVERLIREFENSSTEDIVLESADLADESYDDFSE